MITRAKQKIRQEKLLVRSKISSELRQQKETQIFNTFFQHPGIQNSKTIALYYSIDFLHNLLKQLQIFVKKTRIENYNFN